MPELANHSSCSGCNACQNACPTNALRMKKDEEGFAYPEINEDLCLHCDKCVRVCPVFNEKKPNPVGQAYACINQEETIRMQSSSGGVFTLSAEYVLDCGGVVFGAAFDEERNVCHISVNNKSDLGDLRGSKYVQSDIGDTYKQVGALLAEGTMVLFSGTPCQIGGLRSFLGKEYENLFLQDIICHGVPSPLAWKKYLEYQKKSFNSTITKQAPRFRAKEESWKSYSVFLAFDNEMAYRKTVGQDLFMQAFLHDLCLRPSCYHCQFKSLERQSDITLADFWGINQILPEMDDDKGTSLVFVNTEKGKKLFDEIADKMTYQKVNMEDAVKYNSAAYKSAKMPKKRSEFLRGIKTLPFDVVTKKYLKNSFFLRVVQKVKRVFRGVIHYVQK